MNIMICVTTKAFRTKENQICLYNEKRPTYSRMLACIRFYRTGYTIARPSSRVMAITLESGVPPVGQVPPGC